MNKLFSYLLIAIGIVVVYVLIQNTFPTYTVDSVKEEIDSVKVDIDSAAVYKEYSERIPPQETDTVKVIVRIPTPVEIEGVNHYTQTYSDSLINARWTSQVVGELQNVEFEYYMKRRWVKEKELTIRQDTHIIRTRTITKIRDPTPYFIAGAEYTDLKYLSISGGYVTKKGMQFTYKHNLELNTHSVGVSFPIRFNLRSLF